VLASAAPAQAQIVPGWNTKQFALEQIDADRIRLMREVEIEGEPGSANAGQKFFADDLEMNTRTGELTASGNVVFSTPTSRISSDTVVFNTKTKLGTFTNATGIAQLGERGRENQSMFGTLEPDVYFYGAEIEKVGPDKYRISKGGFTTCVQPTPRWEIVSGRATVNLDDYVIMRNAVIRVKDVPVFYLPLMYYPIQEDDRATGFLLPTYGNSTYQGSSISNAFFWAVNRSHDVTMFHDWFFNRGTGMGSEYRYMLAPTAQGNFRAYWLDEKEAVINGAQRPAKKSQVMSGGLSQGLPLGLSARARVDYFSDVTTQQLYENNFIDAARSTRSVSGGLSGAWRGLSTSATYQRTENFVNPTSSYVSGSAPGLTMSYSGQKLPFLPVYASMNAEAARVLYIENGQTRVDRTLDKVDLLPSLRAPLSSLPYLTVNATLAYRTTYFSESLADDLRTQIDEPVTRSYADMRADIVGPVFSRVFSPNNRIADRLKHIIEPSYSVQRRTAISDESRIPQTGGGYDTVVGGSTQFAYGLANRLLVRNDTATGESQGAPREMLNVSIRQTYYSDERASQYDNSYTYGYILRPPSPFSPIALVAKAAPMEPMALDLRMEYDPRSEADVKLIGYGLNGTFRTNMVDASAGWSKQAFGSTSGDRSNNYVQQSTQVRLAGGKYGGTVSFNYDIARSTLLNQRYIAFYNAQCCGISFEYLSYNYGPGTSLVVPQNRRFNMSFTLAGVGSFSNFFGAFGGGTY
jgi:hypothetical protein